MFVEEAFGDQATLLSQVSVVTGMQVRVLYWWQEAKDTVGPVKLDGTGHDLLIPVDGRLRTLDVQAGQARQLSFTAGPGQGVDLAW